MGNKPFKGTVIIAPSPKKRAAAPYNHFRKTPNPASEHRSRAPDNNTRPTTYAEMAKVANDIPTPKPVHKESDKPKPPESAQDDFRARTRRRNNDLRRINSVAKAAFECYIFACDA